MTTLSGGIQIAGLIGGGTYPEPVQHNPSPPADDDIAANIAQIGREIEALDKKIYKINVEQQALVKDFETKCSGRGEGQAKYLQLTYMSENQKLTSEIREISKMRNSLKKRRTALQHRANAQKTRQQPPESRKRKSGVTQGSGSEEDVVDGAIPPKKPNLAQLVTEQPPPPSPAPSLSRPWPKPAPQRKSFTISASEAAEIENRLRLLTEVCKMREDSAEMQRLRLENDELYRSIGSLRENLRQLRAKQEVLRQKANASHALLAGI